MSPVTLAHHSSRPNEGINASLKMAKILEAIDAYRFQFKRHPLLIVNNV